MIGGLGQALLALGGAQGMGQMKQGGFGGDRRAGSFGGAPVLRDEFVDGDPSDASRQENFGAVAPATGPAPARPVPASPVIRQDVNDERAENLAALMLQKQPQRMGDRRPQYF